MSNLDLLLIIAGGYLLIVTIWQIWITPWLRRQVADDAGIGACTILLGWYARLVHRISISGQQHLKGLEGPLIVACNHSSPIDPLLVQAGFPKFIQWMMAMDQMPPDSQMIWRFTRVIPTDRRRPSARSAIKAIRGLRSGRIIGIFPEGQIAVPPERIMPFHQGVGELASRTGSPVLLVHISGTSGSMSIAGAFLRRSRTHIHFLGVMSWPEKSDPALITADLQQRLMESTGWPAAPESPPLPDETDPFLP